MKLMCIWPSHIMQVNSYLCSELVIEMQNFVSNYNAEF